MENVHSLPAENVQLLQSIGLAEMLNFVPIANAILKISILCLSAF